MTELVEFVLTNGRHIAINPKSVATVLPIAEGQSGVEIVLSWDLIYAIAEPYATVLAKLRGEDEPNVLGPSEFQPKERLQCQGVGEPAPETWDDCERQCIATFGGGYHDDKERDIFHHGMRTIFNMMRASFKSPAECQKGGAS